MAEKLSFQVNGNHLMMARETANTRHILRTKNGFSHRGTGSSKRQRVLQQRNLIPYSGIIFLGYILYIISWLAPCRRAQSCFWTWVWGCRALEADFLRLDLIFPAGSSSAVTSTALGFRLSANLLPPAGCPCLPLPHFYWKCQQLVFLFRLRT